jgi:hypothetical protein
MGQKAGISRWGKLSLAGGWLLIGLVVLGLSVWQQVGRQVSQQLIPETLTKEKSLFIPSEIVPVDYLLPAVGMLPDHPLYILKVIAERVELIFTRDPMVQMRLKLLYADKRLSAAEALLDKGKSALAVETAIKGEKYLADATNQMEDLGNQVPRELWQKADKTAAVHLKALKAMREAVIEPMRPALDAAIARTDQVQMETKAESVEPEDFGLTRE